MAPTTFLDKDFDLLRVTPPMVTGEDPSLPLPPPGSSPARTPRLSLPLSPSLTGSETRHTEPSSCSPAGTTSSGWSHPGLAAPREHPLISVGIIPGATDPEGEGA